jgi:hypothetical protein
MPTIAEAVQKNETRLAKGGGTLLTQAPLPPAPAPITFAPTTSLPLRSIFPPEIYAADGVTAGSQPARPAQRSSVWLAPPAVSNDSTPTTLANKKLTAPIIGNGSKLSRYNSIKATVTPKSVSANSHATQSFVIAGVQGNDKVAGYQWNTAQINGVVVLAVRVTSTNNLAIDFYNPTGGPLTPTGGSITLFLFQ